VTGLLVLKLVLTPLLIAAATVAGRRWGPGVGGWVAGFPLTSGPVSLFLALEQGPEFASVAAVGTLLGLCSTGLFCLVYARVARRLSWLASALLGLAVFALCTLLLKDLVLPVGPAFALVCAFLLATAALMRVPGGVLSAGQTPRWDLPLRMAVAVTMVVGLTAIAERLGAALTGLLSPVPVFALVLAASTHRADGPLASALLLRGVVVGSVAFATFFVVVGAGLARLGITTTYLLASLSALAVNGAMLGVVRR
jgi:hypothetical protein